MTALNDWLERSGIEDGPVFRRVDRHGDLLDGRLSGAAVSLVSARDIADLTWAINSTPRKCLGFKTPAEAFLENINRCT